MARMTFKAGDEFARKLDKLGAESDEIAKKAIYAGARIVTDKMRSNLKSVIGKGDRSQSTGDLENSLGITPIALDKQGNLNAKIGFTGYDRKGVPNQLKARVLESGSSKQQKRPFVAPAVRATRKSVRAEMNRIIDEETKRIMD